ncbi:MAG: LysM peptidoglycan-binding domain-containing protein, partial [Clostridia bacterium]|nr:LysM peptidoglycan-binding domain-containing protein [Clostridia bacterium]
AYIIAEDSDNIPTFYEKAIDFEYTHPMDTLGEFKCSPEITVTGANYTLTGECNMELRIDLNICASVYKCSNVPLITEIKVNDKPVQKTNSGAMTVYFASTGERIWDIARRYFADVEELKQINEISDDILTSDKMILVPTN